MAIFSSYILHRMKNRTKSAIINLSSYSCTYPMPYLATYAATKAFNDLFSKCCSR